MNKANIEFIIYLIGIAPLGLFYSTIKEVLGGKLIFLCAVIFYLIIIMFSGKFIAKKWYERNNQ
jgi:hypothetical protein